MRYDTRTYFVENQDESVKGFTIIDETQTEYHIAEKWIRQNSEDSWIQYHIPKRTLHERVNASKCEPKKELTDEQFSAVCEKIDHSKVEPGELIV